MQPAKVDVHADMNMHHVKSLLLSLYFFNNIVMYKYIYEIS